MKFINEIKAIYLQYIEKNGKRPNSIKQFCQIANLSETEFESYFYSFEWLEDSIWQDLGKWTVQLSEKYEGFNNMNLRKKLSIFLHTLLQLMNSQPNFVKISLRESTVLQTDLRTYPNCLTDFKTELYSFLQKHDNSISQNQQSIADFVWLHFLLVVEKWQTDDSENKEDTQATIEGGLSYIFK
jgi:hypothetical protein